MVMGKSKNLRVFNFAILLISQKFDAHEIYMFYSRAVPTAYFITRLLPQVLDYSVLSRVQYYEAPLGVAICLCP